MRRFIPILALLAVSSGVMARGAEPASGTVVPPAGRDLVGPKITWQGERYTVGANQDFECDETHPCDVFHLIVAAPAGYWTTRGGGVTVRISGYDENTDFDMFIFEEKPDGTFGRRVAGSAGPAGQLEKATIRKATGKYAVVIYPYQVVDQTYEGEAYFDVAPLRKRPVVTEPPGLPVYRASHDQYLSHSEPSIAMNPLNHKNLVAGSKMYTNLEAYRFKIGTYYSMDGGVTWKDNGFLPGYPADNENHIVSDPALTFDDEGNAYAFVLDSAPDWSGMNVHISRDGGRTWTLPIVVHRWEYTEADLGLIFDDKNWIVVDNSGADDDGTVGIIYTCWNMDITTPLFFPTIVVSRSTDAGATWSPPVPIHTPGESVIGCQVVTGPAGELYVFWSDYEHEEIRFVKSVDHGVTFTLPAALSSLVFPRRLPNTAFRNPIFPSAAIGPDGAVTVIWEDGRFSAKDDQGGDADIAVSRSTDGGSTWSAPARVNDDRLGNGADQIQPWLAATEKGKLAAIFFDRRHDPSNTFLDTYVALSTDGSTWRNVRVTPNMWDSSINPPLVGGGEFIGDYQGIVADEEVAIPFWNDTSTGVYQEVWAARVPFTSPSRTKAKGQATKVLGSHRQRTLPATGVEQSPLALPLTASALLLAWVIRRRSTASSRRGA